MNNIKLPKEKSSSFKDLYDKGRIYDSTFSYIRCKNSKQNVFGSELTIPEAYSLLVDELLGQGYDKTHEEAFYEILKRYSPKKRL